MGFTVPVHLADLTQPRDDRYAVAHVSDVLGRSDAAQHALLDEAVALGLECAAGTAASLASGEAFDLLFSFVVVFDEMPAKLRSRVVHALAQTLNAVVAEIQRGEASAEKLRDGVIMATYLLSEAAAAAEKMERAAEGRRLAEPKDAKKKRGAKKTGRDEVDTEELRKTVLGSLRKAVGADMARLWPMGVAPEEFLLLFPRAGLALLESKEAMRTKVLRTAAVQLISAALQRFPNLTPTVAAGLLQAITISEAAGPPASELCALVAAAAASEVDATSSAEGDEPGAETGGDDEVETAADAEGHAGAGTAAVEKEASDEETEDDEEREDDDEDGDDDDNDNDDDEDADADADEDGPSRRRAGRKAKAAAKKKKKKGRKPGADAAPASQVSKVADRLATSRLGATNFHLAREVLREIAAKPMTAEMLKTHAETVRLQARFLVRLSERVPQVVLANLSQLVRHLDSEAYPIRAAVVAAVGQICAQCFQEDPDAAEDPVDEAAKRRQRDTRDELLDLLIERAHDVSAYVRSPVLRVWAALAVAGAVPKARLHAAVQLALDRLRDRSAVVRKAAGNLVVALLEHNPFFGSLDPAVYGAEADACDAWIQAHPPPAIAATLLDEDEDGRGADATDEDPFAEERERKHAALAFLQAAAAFATLLDSGAEILAKLLRSRVTSDVVVALRFFRAARQFRLPCAGRGLRASLGLIWHRESDVRDAAVETFLDIYVQQPRALSLDLDADEDEAAAAAARAATVVSAPRPPDQVAKNLCVLVAQTTPSETASLESLLVRLVAEERVDMEVWRRLWGVLHQHHGGPKWARLRAAAMQLLALGGQADPNLIAMGLRHLVQDVLTVEAVARCDWVLLRHAADALLCLPSAVAQAADPSKALPRRVVEAVCARLLDVLASDCVDEEARGREPADAGAEAPEDALAGAAFDAAFATAGEDRLGRQWFPACEAAVDAVVRLHRRPEALLRPLIARLAARLLGPGAASHAPPVRLARCLFLVAHVAVALLRLAEELAGEVKRLRAARQAATTAAATEAAAAGPSDAGEEDADGDFAAQMSMDAAADHERDVLLAQLADQELVCRHLLGAFGPLLVSVVANKGGAFQPTRYRLLREAASLGLCKFAAVSARYCVVALPLVFTQLDLCAHASVRATLVAALADLVVRFPNEVEPWTPNLYARLRDASRRVRRHTLAVLTLLVQNDMVKVKGNVSEVALCLEDDDPRLVDAARIFFQELSRRGDSRIYNLLPDIISRLSAAASQMIGSKPEAAKKEATVVEDDPSVETEVDPEDNASNNTERLRSDDLAFRRIITFLLTFIAKDKHAEALLEKMALRLAQAPHARAARDLSFCMGELRMSEKALRKLVELLPRYRAQLADRDTFRFLAAIAAKAKRLGTPQQAQVGLIADEWLVQLEIAHNGGSEDDAVAARAAKASKRATQRLAGEASTSKTPRKSTRRIVKDENEAADPNVLEAQG